MTKRQGFERLLAIALITALAVSVPAKSEIRAAEDWRALYLNAQPILDLRYRFEYINQKSLPEQAKASTLRTRAGLESGRVFGLGLAFDAEWIETLGGENFDDTINGKSRFPVVADPDDLQVNQLYLVADNTLPDTLFKLGRQRVIWDNARFVGNVGFRQNEQTFDAFRGVITMIPETALEYLYLNRVHRIFGTDSPAGELELAGHGLRLHYTGLDWLTLTPFALLLDYDSRAQAGFDSQSYGILLGGSRVLDDDWRLLYEGSLAYQEDHADNPASFDLWYLRLEPGLAYRGITLKAGYELLEGDGSNAFQTPLATLHKFNGFTDQFLVTPPDGLEDFYLSLAVPLPTEGWLSDLTFRGGYHHFQADRGGADYGWEWDAGLFKTFALGDHSATLGIQFAAYDAEDFKTDTQKLWLTLGFKLGPAPLRSYLGESNE